MGKKEYAPFSIYVIFQSKGQLTLRWCGLAFWIVLTFATMGCPAIVCFSVLKRDKVLSFSSVSFLLPSDSSSRFCPVNSKKRHQYRKSLTAHQRTFLERQLAGRIPASYLRFLWFMAVLGIAMFALVAGQGLSLCFSFLKLGPGSNGSCCLLNSLYICLSQYTTSFQSGCSPVGLLCTLFSPFHLPLISF